jgi:hypothetical protein
MPQAVLVPILISTAVSAGGMALQYLLAPKVKRPPVDPGKAEDIRIQGSDYGTIIPKTWGKTRIAGNVYWTAGTQVYTVTTGGSRGGKKGQGATPPQTQYIYKTRVGILFRTGRPVVRFLRIWADADLLTNNVPGSGDVASFEAESGSLSGGATIGTSGTGWTGSGYVATNNGTWTLDISTMTPPPAPVNRDPDEFVDPKTLVYFYYRKAGDCTATVSNNLGGSTNERFPASAEWTTKAVIMNGFVDWIRISGGSPTGPEVDRVDVQYYWDRSVFEHELYRVSGVVNPTIDYPTDLDDPSGYYNYDPEAVKSGTTGTYALTTPVPEEVIRFYTGTETQTADAAIKNWLDQRYGIGQGDIRASAMRGITHIVFQDRTLRNGRIENFTVETDTGDATVNTILGDLFAEVGLTPNDYDLSATAGLSMIGYLDHQNTTRKTLVEGLERYHGFRIGEIDGKIKTIKDTSAASEVIPSSSLRAHNEGSDAPDHDAEVLLKEENLLPREVRVSILQPDIEYHNEPYSAKIIGNVVGKKTVDHTFPIVDTPDNGRLAAEKIILKEYSELAAVEFFGMPGMARHAIGDVVWVHIKDSPVKVRIEKRQKAVPIGPIRFQGVTVNPFVTVHYQADVTELAPKAAEQFVGSTFPRNSVAFVIPSEPIREEDRQKLGVYLAISGRGRGIGQTAALYRELAEDNFVLQNHEVSTVPLGLCTGILGNHAGGTASIDSSNTLDIWFFDEVELETATQSDIDRHPHTNLIRVGNEWIQFRTAAAQTLEANSPYRSKWRLSNLWRGRYNTAAAIGAHVANEYAAIANTGLMFYELDPSDVGETVTIKMVTSGQSVEVAPETTFTFSPVGVPTAIASETLAASSLVNVYNDNGTVKVRKANATDNTKPCTGYVLRPVSTSDSVYIITQQGSVITGLSGLIPGTVYYLSATGTLTAAAPSTAGNIVQRIGTALSTTSLIFEPGPVIEKA